MIRPEQRKRLAIPPETPANERAGLKEASSGCKVRGWVYQQDRLRDRRRGKRAKAGEMREGVLGMHEK